MKLLTLFMLVLIPFRAISNNSAFYSQTSPNSGPDTTLSLPALTFHLGVSNVFSNGKTRLNSPGFEGTLIDQERDLDFPVHNLQPRFNVLLRLGIKYNFILDLYTIRRNKKTSLPRNINFGNSFYEEGERVRSKFHLYNLSLSYRYPFSRSNHYNFGALIGLTALDYSLSINQNSIEEKEDLLVPVPTIGLDGFIFIRKDLFVRGVVKFSALKYKNLQYTLFSFKPYFEYYFLKNIGVGMRYHFAYTNLDNEGGESFDGTIRFNFQAVSLFTCIRFF